MRRKTAKELLAESFRELAQTKKVDKITVQEIVDNCGYSTATFYRQFQDKYDLIAWDYARETAAIMGRLGKGGQTLRRTLLDWTDRFQREREYLKNLLTHTSGHDSFIQYMTENHCAALSDFVRAVSGRKQLDQKTELQIRIYCMGTVCLGCEWILGKFDISPEELAEIYENALPEMLRQYLVRNRMI